MTVDISRVTFVPRNNYAALIEQQGRVGSDADGTEDGAIQDRRWRAESLDLIGRAGVPGGLPDSFRIEVAGGGLVIHPGRIYVDGLLAENHGNAPFVFDPVLAETHGTGTVPFDQQPYRPGFAPPPPAPGRHLIYLDVWQRTVTYLEDPALIEPAVGVDTTARVQTVWQVRDLAGIGNADCETPDAAVPGWDAITRPSDGRLSSRAHVGPPQVDPCLLPPGSGYTGLENRTYRVEIHDESPAGQFRFKWSRYNATVATEILALPSGDVLRVARVARDDVLRFNPGDWVEVTDDRRELEGTPGIIRQVQAVDDAARTIELAVALPAGVLAFDGGGPELDPAFHPRVRRWEQSGVVRDSAGAMLLDLNAPGSEGVIPVPAAGTFVQLDDGVEVGFDLAQPGGRFRPGDFWVFIARTLGRQVEELTAAPPFGIHHHYCRLAVVDAGAAGWTAPVVDDCRPSFPDGTGCCTFVVEPGESIQDAIDNLPPAGGCVCLKAGLHAIGVPIAIARDNVSLHGESLGAVVQSRGGGLLVVSGFGRAGIRVASITFRQGSTQRAPAPMIVVEGTDGFVVHDCRLECLAGNASGVGVLVTAGEATRVESTRIEGCGVGIWLDTRCEDVVVVDNKISMARPAANMPVTVGLLAHQVTGAITVHGNEITGAVSGVVINDQPSGPPRSLASRSGVSGNRLRLVAAGAAGERGFGIDVAAELAIVSGNHVTYGSASHTGIRVSGHGSIVQGNILRSLADLPGAAIAIVVGFVEGDDILPLERVLVADNEITGAQHGVLVIGVTRGSVSGNALGSQGSAGIGIALTDAHDCQVAHNTLARSTVAIGSLSGERNHFVQNSIDRAATGILLFEEAGPAVSGNRVFGTRQAGIIVLRILAKCDIVENRLTHCGFGGDLGLGIAANGVWGELHVESNEVMNTGVSPDPGGAGPAVAWGISANLTLEARIRSNLVTYSDPSSRPPAAEDRALIMRGLLEITVVLGAGSVSFGFPVQIGDNKFIGTGATALVQLLSTPINDSITARFERVFFTGNYCNHLSVPFNDQVQAATVSLLGRRCVVSNNQVKAATGQFRSYHFHGMPGPFLGNISHAGSWGRAAAAEFPSPESAFNMVA